MSIKVLKPGLLTTIQDLGRTGFQKHGVLVSGAMDTYSLRVANLLVANDEKEACLEMTLMGPTIEFEKDCVIAITGGDLAPSINNEPVHMWKPIYVSKGSTLQFGPCKKGCRAYLAVKGGFLLSPVMNSKSTYLRGELGGYKGRALQANDVIKFTTSQQQHVEVASHVHMPNWYVNFHERLSFEKKPIIRVIKGSQFDLFTKESQQAFSEQAFKVSTQSDRMGYRIAGPELALSEKVELLSEAVTNGSIQVPPDGNPIILLADRQTTGGYPKMAQVITADLPVLAQVKPGESIYFQYITLEEAEQIYLENEKTMKQLACSIALYQKEA
ncbi:5-oxoprolinase subunit C family protein [Priestia flexa]|jgi:antagonist of KipI|uniref:5-oxoprolinase subunit C family protein n=1 Tax=Priestia flexa TaxID=86664 RepID=UPI000E67BC08|nr:biotin-dependent carboxyltransferase family protein [Priestia flexa]MCM3067580.1 biotin-dependent carboxyltransferase family protein [Priestia flexa]RIV05295.1 biotin-dependent carboxyltransferase family protein [Priestia flexa]UZW65454.1 biotin-dependent carboxyltransferase family protein [Priestia flexa]